jgi:acyl carrier protein
MTDFTEIIEYIMSKSDGVLIDNDTDLLVSGVLDSLGIIELIALISDIYSIKFNTNELVLENFNNVRSIITLIDSKI